MNRDQAEKLCRQQAEEHADRDTHDLRPLIHQNIPPGGADGEAGDGD